MTDYYYREGLKERGITADKMAKGELTELQCKFICDFGKVRTCNSPKNESFDVFNVYYFSNIVRVEDRYFHITEKIIHNFCKDVRDVTFIDIYEVEKIEKMIPVIEYVRKREDENMEWHTEWGDFPELYKEVEILMTDGSLKRDMMIKGKYGNYEWRNWSNKYVVGWRPIENTTQMP